MKKLFALALLSLGLAHNAAAAPSGPAWGCQIDANLHGRQRGLVIAYKILEGVGTMRCASVSGEELREFPVRMRLEGAGLGFGWGNLRNQNFLTGSIGVTEPGYMYGKYQGQLNADATVVNVNGTAGIGLEFSKNSGGMRGLAVKGVLSGGDARGAFLGVTLVKVEISPL